MLIVPKPDIGRDWILVGLIAIGFCTAYFSSPIMYFSLALQSAYNNDFVNSIELNTKAINLNPKFAEAYNNRANGYLSLGDNANAYSDYNKAVELNPNTIHIENRGLALCKMRKYTRAIKDFSRVISIDDKNQEALFLRGKSFLELKNTDKALKDFSNLIDIGFNGEEIHLYLGFCHFDLGHFENAVDEFSEYIELNPNELLGYTNRANSYIMLGKTELARKDYMKALELKPDHAYAINGMGDVYSNEKNTAQAISCYNKALAQDKYFQTARQNLAWAYFDQKQYEQALITIEDLLAICNTSEIKATNSTDWQLTMANGLLTKADIKLKQNDKCTALHCLRKAYKHLPDEFIEKRIKNLE